MLNGYDVATARDALYSIPHDLPRADWHRAGRAGIACGLSVDDIASWSAGASNYKSEQDVRAAFRTIMPEGGTGPGTLFMIAAEHGWTPPDPEPKPDGPRKAAPGMSPAEVWERSEPATFQHPYIDAKNAAGVPLDTLRVLPAGDGLRIAGASMAGALVVPASAPDGTLQSLQLIPPQGKKMNLPGSPMAGAMFTVGTLTPGEVVYIGEGIGQAWATWQATGQAAVCTFGFGGMARIAAQLRQGDQTARLVICPDVGKESDAEKIALEHGCQ